MTNTNFKSCKLIIKNNKYARGYTLSKLNLFILSGDENSYICGNTNSYYV